MTYINVGGDTSGILGSYHNIFTKQCGSAKQKHFMCGLDPKTSKVEPQSKTNHYGVCDLL